MASKKGDWVGFPGVPTAIGILACIAVIMAVAWPVEAFHGNARWVGEGIWAGIVTAAITAGATAYYRAHRDERKLKRLRNERLRAEGRHPAQLRAQEARQALQRTQQANEQERKAAEQQRQWLRDAIKCEERMREERLRGGQ